MAIRPDLEMMIVTLDRYRAEIEDDKAELEKEAEEEEETDVCTELIEKLEVKIEHLTDAIEALENLT